MPQCVAVIRRAAKSCGYSCVAVVLPCFVVLAHALNDSRVHGFMGWFVLALQVPPFPSELLMEILSSEFLRVWSLKQKQRMWNYSDIQCNRMRNISRPQRPKICQDVAKGSQAQPASFYSQQQPAATSCQQQPAASTNQQTRNIFT